jgi:hypothetical protein
MQSHDTLTQLTPSSRLTSLESKWNATIPEILDVLPFIRKTAATLRVLAAIATLVGGTAIGSFVLVYRESIALREDMTTVQARVAEYEAKQRRDAEALQVVAVRLERISTQIESLQQLVVEQRDELRRARGGRD